MRVLLSTIGSRGDVQPLVALALQLRALGQEVRLCVPPDFREWIEGLGIPVTPIGPELRTLTAATPAGHAGAALARAAAPDGGRHGRHPVRDGRGGGPRAATSSSAATALQIAARSVAETDGHPVRLRRLLPGGAALAAPCAASAAADAGTDAAARDTPTTASSGRGTRERLNDTVRRRAQRASRIARPGAGRRRAQPHLHRAALAGRRPDAGALARSRGRVPCSRPAPGSCRTSVRCPRELEAFLDAGEPPVYFGFGSIRAPQDLSQVMIETARALGRRAIVSRGWADLSLVDDEPDCLAIGEVNQQALFTARRRRRPPRRRGHHDRGRAGRRAAGRHPPDVRPALLGATRPGARHRRRARTRRADHRVADERARAHAPTRRGGRRPIHRRCGAQRRRTGRRAAIDECRGARLARAQRSAVGAGRAGHPVVS